MDFVILFVAAITFVIAYIILANLKNPWENAPPGHWFFYLEIHKM